MLESVSDDVKKQSEIDKYIDIIEEFVDGKCRVSTVSKLNGYNWNGIYLASNFWGCRLGTVNFDDYTIKVYDKKLYDGLKRFGKVAEFGTLIKCWDGADKE